MIGPMLTEAWSAMAANRLRSFLTMLGMVIGVGAVIMMLAIGQGAQYEVDGNDAFDLRLIGAMHDRQYFLAAKAAKGGFERSIREK